MPDDQLTPEQLKQLDSNIRNMLSQGASQDDVVRYSNDYKAKFAVKKKLSGGIGSSPSSLSEDQRSNIIEFVTGSKPVQRNAQQEFQNRIYGNVIQDFQSLTQQEKKDPVKNINKKVVRDGDVLVAVGDKPTKTHLIENLLAPTGYQAQQNLNNPLWKDEGEDNETKKLLKPKADEYSKVSETIKKSLQGSNEDLTQANEEYIKTKYTDKLTNAAIIWKAGKDKNFAEQLKARGIDLNDSSLSFKIDSYKTGSILQEFLSDPNTQSFVIEEKPNLLPAFEVAHQNILKDNPRYGINVVANKVSQARQEKGLNDNVVTFDNELFRNTTNLVAEEVLTPDELEIYNDHIKSNPDKYIATPSLFENFAKAAERTLEGVVNTAKQPFASVGESIKDSWEKEVHNVTAGEKGLDKFLAMTGDAFGTVAGIASIGSVTGMTPAVALAFGGDALEQARLKYPDSPAKAYLSAIVETGLYAAMGSKIFPVEKISKALSSVKPELTSIVERLVDGQITRSAARKEFNSAFEKAIDFTGGTALESAKIAGELTSIEAANRVVDKLLMDDETFQKYHDQDDFLESFAHNFMANLGVAGLAKYGQMKGEQKPVEQEKSVEEKQIEVDLLNQGEAPERSVATEATIELPKADEQKIKENETIQATTESPEPITTEQVSQAETKPIEAPQEPTEKPPGEPPKEPVVEAFVERPGTELSFRGLQNVANEFGYEDVTSRDRVSDLQELTNARNTALDWAEKGEYQKNVDALLEGIKKKELVPTAKQRLILQQYLANESKKLRDITDKNSKEFDEQLNKVKEIKRVGQIARQETGAALRIPQGGQSHPVQDFADAMVAMSEAKGDAELTIEQKNEVEGLVKKYEERAVAAEKMVADMQAKFAEMQATKGVEKQKKTKEQFKSERDSIRKSIKEKWAAAAKDDVLTAVAIPYAKQLVAIAPDVAKLVKSYVSEGVTEFSEVVKRIHELIKEVNPDVQESDVIDVIAGRYNEPKETKTDLEKKLKQIKDKNSAEAITIRARIKSGDFEKREIPNTWVNNKEFREKFPKDYKATLDAIADKEQAQLDFDIAAYKEQLKKRYKGVKGKGRWGIDLARAAISTTKAVKSGIDDSAVMMQNIVAMFSHPRSAAKALREHALDALSERRFRRYLTELHESPIWDLIQQSGLDITDPKSLKEQNKEEIFDNNLLNKDLKIGGKKYNIGKYLTRPFERAFTSLGNAMRVNMFTRISEKWMEEGRTFETHPKDFKSLATLLNTETGRGKLHTQIQRASQLVTAGIWSPRLMASRLNMLGISDIVSPLYGGKGYYAGLTPEVRKLAAKDMAKFIGAGLALMGLAGFYGAELDDNPESPTFGTIKVGDKKYNAWGGMTPYVKTIVQGFSGKRKINGERKDVKRGKIIGQFFRSRLTPAAGVTTNILTGKDYSGKPITPLGELENLIAPISVINMKDAIERDGMVGVLTQGLPSFIGIGVSDERDFEKKERTFKVYNKFRDKVREATPEEVKKTNEEKEVIYQQQLKNAEKNKGWGYTKAGELTTSDDAIKRKGNYNELSDEDKEELQSRLKSSAAREAKNKIKY